MSPFSPIRPRRPIRVVLSSTALLPFLSVRKAAALAIAQLGIGAFFIAGVTGAALGESAAWFVLAATLLAAFVRAIDVESWALLIPGGFITRVTSAFGVRASGLARAAVMVERVLLGALASVVIGHYVASVSATAIAGLRFTGFVRPEDLATLIAIAVIALLWLPTRIGRDVGRDALARAVWIGVAILLVTIAWGVATAARGVVFSSLAVPPPVAAITPWAPLDMALAILLGFALTLPVLGGGEALARAAHELPPPRVQALRRTGRLTVLFAGVTTTLGTFLALLLVPASEQPLWANAPLAGLAQHLAAPLHHPGPAGRGAGGRGGVDPGTGGPRRVWRHRADASSCLDRRHAAVGAGIASQQVRHTRPRGGRHGSGDDSRGARDRRAGGLAVAGLRDRDCRDARADDRIARPAPAGARGARSRSRRAATCARAAARFRWACSPSRVSSP